MNKAFEDDYGEVFAVGDKALKALWYMPVKKQDFKYLLDDTISKSYIHASSVIHIRFALIPCEAGKGAARRYTLQEEALQAITESL